MTWQEKVKAAHDMVSALCKPRGSEGSREWIMSIPARRDYDPDLIISAGLSAAEARIAELEESLQAEISDVMKVRMDLSRAGAFILKLEARIAELEGKLEDIRMEVGCARGQRTTQFCADLTAAHKSIAELQEENNRLDEELDATRQYACTMDQQNADYGRVANELCYAKERIAELEAERDGLRDAVARMKQGSEHNAAEVARVKVESLRVVKVGEPVLFDHIRPDQFVLMDGHVFAPDKLRCQLVRITDNLRVDVQQQFMDDVKFQPVRLERWEHGE